MSYTLLRQTKPKARKDHRCIWCGQIIPKGTNYIRERSVYDGNMQNHAWHNECLPACQEMIKDSQDDSFDPYENERPKS